MTVISTTSNMDHRTLLSSKVVGDIPNIKAASALMLVVFTSVRLLAELANLLNSRGRHSVDRKQRS